VIVAARNEADRIGAALDALGATFPEAKLVVADDASTDGTGDIALAHGAELAGRRRPHGKGANVTAAAQAALSSEPPPAAVLLCDADLASTASRLTPLVEAIDAGDCDLAIGAFRRRLGGGFGIALRFSRWAIERRCGRRFETPISGQRAMSAEVLRALIPFASGYGMETGMTIDAVRAGYRISEIELDLEHRATYRTPSGFLHRARQLLDFVRVYISRR
jgi:glycosyltransferase involved in cell wall biosynthesis